MNSLKNNFLKTSFCFFLFLFISNTSFGQNQKKHTRESLVPIMNTIVDGMNVHMFRTRARNHIYSEYLKKNILKNKAHISLFVKADFKYYLEKDREGFRIAKENVKFLPRKWAEIVEKDLLEIEKFQNEEIRLNKELSEKTAKSIKVKDRDFIKKSLIQLIQNTNKHDELVRKVHSDFETILKDYPHPDSKNSWVRSSNYIQEVLKKSENILDDLKYEKREIALQKLVALDSLKSFLEKNQIEILKGIKKYPYYGGHPHSNYEMFVIMTKKFIKVIRENSHYRRNMTNHNTAISEYTNLVKYYNSFVDQAMIKDNNHDTPSASLLKYPLKKYYIKVSEEDLYFEKENLPNQITENLKMDGFKENHLIILLDISRSMVKEERLPLFKKAMEEIASIMRKEDVFSVVLFSDKAETLFEQKSITEKTVLNKLLNVKSFGKTNINLGIKKAYSLANKKFDISKNTRILMVTDGDFKISNDLNEKIKMEKQRIQFSVFNFGEKNIKNSSLQKLTKNGNGNHVYITIENHISALLNELRKK